MIMIVAAATAVANTNMRSRVWLQATDIATTAHHTQHCYPTITLPQLWLLLLSATAAAASSVVLNQSTILSTAIIAIILATAAMIAAKQEQWIWGLLKV